MIEIHVRLHGILRDTLPVADKGRTTLTYDENPPLSAVLEQLSLKRRIVIAVNNNIVEDMNVILYDGDKLELFRPSAGG